MGTDKNFSQKYTIYSNRVVKLNLIYMEFSITFNHPHNTNNDYINVIAYCTL